MAIYVGGLRDRLIHDSVYHLISNGLTTLGWFNSNPTGFTYPVQIIPEQVPWDEELAFNTITIAPGQTNDQEWEVGTFAMKNEKQFYIDVYGENEALSLHLSGDIRDILRGKFAAEGYSQATLNVYDYTQVTPPWIFFCDIENVQVDRAQNFPHLWQRYLYIVSFDVCDYYTNDQDSFAYGSEG
jgi:hypothetical protein